VIQLANCLGHVLIANLSMSLLSLGYKCLFRTMVLVFALCLALSLGYVLRRSKHFLLVLLGLELVLIRGYALSCLLLGSDMISEGNIMMGLLVLAVCEACLGLGLLVCRCRSAGVDMLGGLFSLGGLEGGRRGDKL